MANDQYNQGLGPFPRGDRPMIQGGRFIALGPVKGWTVLTDGGLRVTPEHEVLHKDGSIINGLYAAGSVGQGGLLLEGHGHLPPVDALDAMQRPEDRSVEESLISIEPGDSLTLAVLL